MPTISFIMEKNIINISVLIDFPECKLTELGEEYRGSRATTASGLPCRAWDQIPPINISIPEKNYCRNPNGFSIGPWCYVEGQDGVWESCGIPFCKRKGPII